MKLPGYITRLYRGQPLPLGLGSKHYEGGERSPPTVCGGGFSRVALAAVEDGKAIQRK